MDAQALQRMARPTAGFTPSEVMVDAGPGRSFRIFRQGGGWRIFEHHTEWGPVGVCIGFEDTKPQAFQWLADQLAKEAQR